MTSKSALTRIEIIEAHCCALSRRRILGCLAVGHIIELTVMSRNKTQLILKVDAVAGQEQIEMEISGNT